MEKIREEFEAWFWDYHHKDCSMDYWSVIFAIGCDGKYQGVACEGAWQGWKASRASLNAELDFIDARIKHECEKADYLKEACAKIIDDINSIQIERF